MTYFRPKSTDSRSGESFGAYDVHYDIGTLQNPEPAVGLISLLRLTGLCPLRARLTCKPRSCLRMTLAVCGTLNHKSINQTTFA